MTPLWFSGFPFWGDFWALGPLLADSSENFSTERPVFVASPAPMSQKLGTEDFLLNAWRIPRCSLANSKVILSLLMITSILPPKTGIIIGYYSWWLVVGGRRKLENLLLGKLNTNKKIQNPISTFFSKSSVPSFRDTAVRRRHKNGSFGTEIFRRIRHERSRSPEIPKKRKT